MNVANATSADCMHIIDLKIGLLARADLNFLILNSSISLYLISSVSLFSRVDVTGIETNIG